MRVLHVLEALRGGTSRHLIDVVRHARGIEHHVAVPPLGRGARTSGALVDAPALDAIVAAGGCLHWVDMRRTPPHPANALALARLDHLVRYLAPAVVHGHSSVGGALGRVAVAAARRGRDGGRGRGGGRARCVAAVYTPNGLATSGAALAIERGLRPLTDRLVAVSPSEADLALTRLSFPPAKVVTIPNGIDLDPPPPAAIDLRQRIGVAPDTPLVGTVARLVEQKAPAQFVAVCAAVARRRGDAHFLLIGMGPLQAEVDAAVARGGVEGGGGGGLGNGGLGDGGLGNGGRGDGGRGGFGRRFHQIEHLPGAAGALDQLDVFVLASRFEGGPYTPLEAMRAGVPVVLSDVVGNHDAVEHGRSGFLRPFADTDAMAGDVVALLADKALRSRVAAAGRHRLAEHFDVRRMGERLAALYAELASRAPDGGRGH